MSAFKVPYLVGADALTDFFPTDIIQPVASAAPAIPNQQYPVGFTRDQLLILLWRAKTFHLTGSAYGYSSTNPSINTSIAMDSYSSEVNPDFTPCANELGLINTVEHGLTYSFRYLSAYASITKYQENSTGTDSSPCLAPGYESTFLIFYAEPIYYDPDTDLFYPRLNFSYLHICNGIFSAGLTESISSQTAIPTPFTVTLDAGLFSIVLWTTLYAGGYGGDIIYSGSANITVENFWPYTDSNGNPIYDAITGAQINDPFG
jgi:hypothetical protein